MATRSKDLLDRSVNFLDVNAYETPYIVVNSGTTQNPLVFVFKSAVSGNIAGFTKIPDGYVGTPQVEIVWTSETTTGDVDFAFRHRVTDGSDTELLDISTSPTEIENTSIDNTGPSAASEQMITTISLTATDFVAGSMLYWEFERDGVTDTKADDITVWKLSLKYADA